MLFLLLCIFVVYIIIKLRSMSRLCLFVVRSSLLNAVLCVPVDLYYFLIFSFFVVQFRVVFRIERCL